MDPKDLEKIIKWLDTAQVVMPRLVNVAVHYASLQNDPKLQETDKKKMVENLQALKVGDIETL